jgi:predicted DCC family thiol-disulfide oxidoreductase YuxK
MPAEPFSILIDNNCPVCRTEGRMLARLDRGRGKLRVIDIASPDFDPRPLERSLDDLMGEIHGIMPSGDVVTGVEVFRRAYAAVGLGWLLAPTRWPVLRQLSDAMYRVFARNRVRWFGGGCANGACAATAPR